MRKFSQYVMEMETPGAAGQAPAPGAAAAPPNPAQTIQAVQGLMSNPKFAQGLQALLQQFQPQQAQPQQQAQPAQPAPAGQVQQAGTQQVGR